MSCCEILLLSLSNLYRVRKREGVKKLQSKINLIQAYKFTLQKFLTPILEPQIQSVQKDRQQNRVIRLINGFSQPFDLIIHNFIFYLECFKYVSILYPMINFINKTNDSNNQQLLAIKQINSINIFQPSPYPGSVLISNSKISSNERSLNKVNDHYLNQKFNQEDQEERNLQKMDESSSKIYQDTHYIDMSPPSIEYILFENQLNQYRKQALSNRTKIQDIFANQQQVQSKNFLTQKLTNALNDDKKFERMKGSHLAVIPIQQRNKNMLRTVQSKFSENEAQQSVVPQLNRVMREQSDLSFKIGRVQDSNKKLQYILKTLSRLSYKDLTMGRESIFKDESFDLNLFKGILEGHSPAKETH